MLGEPLKLPHSNEPRQTPWLQLYEKKEQGVERPTRGLPRARRYHLPDLLNLLAGKDAHSVKNDPREAPGTTSQMNRYCLPEEGYPPKCIASLMFILPPDNSSEQHRMSMIGMRGRKGQKGATSIKGAKMKLVEGGIPKGPGIQMGMTGTRETPNTIMMLRTADQPEVLETEGIPTENGKKHLLKTSDQQSKTLGGNPETVGYSAGSEAKTDPEWLETYATC